MFICDRLTERLADRLTDRLTEECRTTIYVWARLFTLMKKLPPLLTTQILLCSQGDKFVHPLR